MLHAELRVRGEHLRGVDMHRSDMRHALSGDETARLVRLVDVLWLCPYLRRRLHRHADPYRHQRLQGSGDAELSRPCIELRRRPGVLWWAMLRRERRHRMPIGRELLRAAQHRSRDLYGRMLRHNTAGIQLLMRRFSPFMRQ